MYKTEKIMILEMIKSPKDKEKLPLWEIKP
jgi:hypothetical protein